MGSGKRDEIKGRVKEATGALTGDKDLKRKGQLDQAGGKMKRVVEDAADEVGKAVDKVKNALMGKKDGKKSGKKK